MARVDEVWRAVPSLLARLERRMVTQVCRDIDVGTARSHRIELVITRAAEHGHPRHLCGGVARDPDAAGGVRQGLAEPGGELRQRHGGGQLADAPSGIPLDVGERALGGEPQRGGENAAHTGVGHVGVRVRDVEGDVGDDEPGDARALRAGGGDGVHPTEQEGVMGHEQVRIPCGGLLDDGEGRVEGEEDPSDRLVEVTGDEADPVPRGGTVGRVERLEAGDDVTQHEIFHVGPAGLEPTTPAV